MRLKLLAILGLLVVGGAAIFVTVGGLPSSAAASTTYLTSTAAVADVSDDIAATGAIASSTSWKLVFGAAAGATPSGQNGSPATWRVTVLKANVGDRVKKDQVLAVAANPDLDTAIVTATNDVASAEIQLATANDAYTAATTTATQRQTQTGLLNARNGLTNAESALAELKDERAHNALIAPADAIVTAVNVTRGQDAPATEAIDLSSVAFEVTADVVETDVSSVQVGQTASVTVAAINADLTGSVSAIAPVALASSSSNGVVSYAVTVKLNAPPPTLRPGMTASVTITTASASGVLAVPAAAIRGTSDNYSVLVMTAAGTPQAQPVTVGLMTSSLVEIKSGLSAGDVVITGTTSQQRTGTTNTGGGNFVVPGGGGGGFRGGGGNP